MTHFAKMATTTEGDLQMNLHRTTLLAVAAAMSMFTASATHAQGQPAFLFVTPVLQSMQEIFELPQGNRGEKA